MPNDALVATIVPIEAGVRHFGVDSCSFFITQLSSKGSDTQDVDGRLWKIEHTLNEVLMRLSIVIVPSPMNCADA